MLGRGSSRRSRRPRKAFGTCVPAQQDVHASTVAVDEGQILRLIECCAAKDHRSGPAAEELRVIALENSAKVLIAGLGGIGPMVELMGDERRSAACREACARTLWNLATNNDLKVSIAAAGAISPLVALMSGATSSVGCKEAAAGCLRNLAVTSENAAAIVAAGALNPLVALCRVGPGWNGGDAIACAEAAARALWNLAYDDPGNQVAIARARVRRFFAAAVPDDRERRRRTRARSRRSSTSAGSRRRRAARRRPRGPCGT